MNDLYRPVAYWGTTLKDAELNYTVTEKEALAVIRCPKEYEDMLQGAKVTIVTDHRPLIPLLQNTYKVDPMDVTLQGSIDSILKF